MPFLGFVSTFIWTNVAVPGWWVASRLTRKIPTLKEHPLLDLPLYQREVEPLLEELALSKDGATSAVAGTFQRPTRLI